LPGTLKPIQRNAKEVVTLYVGSWVIRVIRVIRFIRVGGFGVIRVIRAIRVIRVISEPN
jgi:hypothetical protein